MCLLFLTQDDDQDDSKPKSSTWTPGKTYELSREEAGAWFYSLLLANLIVFGVSDWDDFEHICCEPARFCP